MKLFSILLLSIFFFISAEDKIFIYLEHAVTPKELEKGLMDRSFLDANHGMTFNYLQPSYVSIWMYGTKIDLSLAFLDENKIIREIYELKAYPEIKDASFFAERRVRSSFPAKYALEMNRGWFEQHRIKPGDKAVWNVLKPYGYIIRNP